MGNSPGSQKRSKNKDPAPPTTMRSGAQSIQDNYSTVEEVQRALREKGLESSNLILGIDYTKSNSWTGKDSFGGRSLHAIGGEANPYEQCISIIGRTLSAFDDDNLIPVYGFGDVSTHDQAVFSFMENDEPCMGFEHVLMRYRELTPSVNMTGPTSFGPLIRRAIDIVVANKMAYHILIIIADGQVTRSVDLADSENSTQEDDTIQAIVAASEFPLSIVMIGVGDGPFEQMEIFDDRIPERRFDNFQFVNATELMNKHRHATNKDAIFALHALMEIPDQYNFIATHPTPKDRRHGGPAPLPPPRLVQVAAPPARAPYAPPPSNPYVGASAPTDDGPPPPAYSEAPPPFSAVYGGAGAAAPPSATHAHSGPPPAMGRQPSAADMQRQLEAMMCPICMERQKDLAFQCGHQTCAGCGQTLVNCPVCRAQITTRLKLFG